MDSPPASPFDVARNSVDCVRESELAEFQGLYGPFLFPERILQKIWLRRDFSFEEARLSDGRSLVIEDPGSWNRLGGPDFKRARMVMGGRRIVGDVEIHLHEASWAAHAHALDPAYREVVVHVVLFPTDASYTLGVDGSRIPILVLLPLLRRGLEDYADEDAIERLASRAAVRAVDEFALLPLAQRLTLLSVEAERRWAEKVKFATQRVAHAGWEEACHQTALEILGYRFNRLPMLRLSSIWTFDRWRRSEITIESLYRSEAERWSTQGARPANHPYRRLLQYARWVEARPDWPQTLSDWIPPTVEDCGEGSRVLRKRGGWARVRLNLMDALAGNQVTGPRWDTLMCDGWMPLLANRLPGLQSLWRHWFPGDLPPYLKQTLRQMGVISLGQPLCHGLAQGLLGWWIVQERARGAQTDKPTR